MALTDGLRQENAGYRQRMIKKAGDPLDLLEATAKDAAESIIYQNEKRQQPLTPLKTITPHEG